MSLSLLEQLTARGTKSYLPSLDWLTLTVSEEDLDTVREVLDYLKKLMRNLGYEERRLTTSTVSGYKIGKLIYGVLRTNSDKYLVSVSGSYSTLLSQYIPQGIRATRLDACIDFYSPKQDTTIRDAMLDAWDKRELTPSHAKNLTMYGSPNGGFTLYYGKRGKGMLLRVYDKGAEQGGQRDMWFRYEIQFGRTYATRARDAMIDSADHTKWIVGCMNKFCDDRGLYLPPMAKGSYEWVSASRVEAFSDEERKALSFFMRTVKPFVLRFRKYRSDAFLMKELGLKCGHCFNGESIARGVEIVSDSASGG